MRLKIIDFLNKLEESATSSDNVKEMIEKERERVNEIIKSNSLPYPIPHLYLTRLDEILFMFQNGVAMVPNNTDFNKLLLHCYEAIENRA